MENDNGGQPPVPNRIYFYIACAACGLAVIFFGLTFSPLGIYALISSILLGIAALAFTRAQEKKYKFGGIKYVKIAGYAVLIISVLFFIGGLIYSAVV